MACYSSYGYNGRGASFSVYEGLPIVRHLGLAQMCQGENPPEAFNRPVRDEQVRVPSDMIAIGDGFVGYRNDKALEAPYLSRIAPFGWPYVNQPGKQAYERHRRKLNLLFCDGHVAAQPTKTVLYDWSDAWVSKYNYAHEPHPESTVRDFPIP